MADVKLITNVGIFDGQNGKGLIYAGLTVGGSYFFTLKVLGSGGAETWSYYPRTRIETGLASGEVKLVDNLNMTLFIDTATPDFAPGAGSFPTITNVTNASALPRIYNLEAPYSLKGEGILEADIAKLKTGTTTNTLRVETSRVTNADGSVTVKYDDNTTSTIPAATSKTLGFIPTDFSTLVSNPIGFVQDNFIFIAVVVLVFFYFKNKGKKGKKGMFSF